MQNLPFPYYEKILLLNSFIFRGDYLIASVISQDWSGAAFDKHITQGTFYIISLTLAATYFSDLISDIYLQRRASPKKNSELLFYDYKILSFIIVICLIFIIALIYPGIENGQTTSDFSVYVFQITVFLITCFLGAYIFSLKHAYLHQKEMEGLHNEAVKKIIDETERSIDDEEGVKF